MSRAAERRRLIHEVIGRNEVRTQEQLQALLEVEGVATTQATLSRDMRGLGVRKHRGVYRISPGAAASSARRRQIAASLRDAVVRSDCSGGLVIIHTRPGMAHAVALELAQSELHEVLGSIAGVDTVFVATPTSGHARSLLRLVGS